MEGLLTEYTPEEFMIVTMSREVKDGQIIGVGNLSPIPAAAVILAENTHAPNVDIIILGSQEYYPFDTGTSQFHFLAQRGKLDLFFMSGIQIDKNGKVNLTLIGNHKYPKLRMPGAFGTAMLYFMSKKVILFRTEHTRRTLVDKVDFITSGGFLETKDGAPTELFTSMGIFTLTNNNPKWKIKKIHPGYVLNDLLDNMSFIPSWEDTIETTLEPSIEHLNILRTIVKQKLFAIYPEFAKKKIY